MDYKVITSNKNTGVRTIKKLELVNDLSLKDFVVFKAADLKEDDTYVEQLFESFAEICDYNETLETTITDSLNELREAKLEGFIFINNKFIPKRNVIIIKYFKRESPDDICMILINKKFIVSIKILD